MAWDGRKMFTYSVNSESFAVWFPVHTEARASVEHSFCLQRYDMCIYKLHRNLPHFHPSGVLEAYIMHTSSPMHVLYALFISPSYIYHASRCSSRSNGNHQRLWVMFFNAASDSAFNSRNLKANLSP